MNMKRKTYLLKVSQNKSYVLYFLADDEGLLLNTKDFSHSSFHKDFFEENFGIQPILGKRPGSQKNLSQLNQNQHQGLHKSFIDLCSTKSLITLNKHNKNRII